MKCIICNGNKIKIVPLMHEVSRYTKKSYSLFKCTECGLIRPNPLPYGEKTKLDIYDEPENIKFYNQKKNKIDKKSFEYKYYFKHFKPFSELVDKYKINGKVLDVGCGAGHLMEVLSKRGLYVEGIEITSKLVKALSDKFRVYHSEINSKILKKENYDLVTANQVLEHTKNPRVFVVSAKRILKKGGYFIFSVPYLSGIVPQIFRTKWYGLGYGQHLNFFSKKSIKLLLEQEGFKIIESKLLIVDYAHPKFPRIINFIIDKISELFVVLGLGDNLFIVAKKLEKKKNEH